MTGPHSYPHQVNIGEMTMIRVKLEDTTARLHLAEDRQARAENERSRIQACLAREEKVRLDAEFQLGKTMDRLSTVEGQMREAKKEMAAMKSELQQKTERLAKIERQLETHLESKSDGGSYASSAASLSAFHTAVERTHQAIRNLATKLVKELRAARAAPQAMQYFHSQGITFERGTHLKIGVEALLARQLYSHFENEGFAFGGETQYFDPDMRCRMFYNDYMKVMEALQQGTPLDRGSPQWSYLAEFVDRKTEALTKVVYQLTGEEREPANDETPSLSSVVLGTLKDDVRRTILIVWALHKMAFALKPPAAIVRPPPDLAMPVDPLYVEVDDNSPETVDGKLLGELIVLNPGFRAHQSQMKCIVYQTLKYTPPPADAAPIEREGGNPGPSSSAEPTAGGTQ